MNRKYLALLERTMRENMTNRNVTKFQDAYNIYLNEIGLEDKHIKSDGDLGEETLNAASWLRSHNKYLDEEEAFEKIQNQTAEDRLEFYRNWEFTKPSDTLDVKKY